ncbi:MAG: glycine oxidase ThiO [Planctomycetia bacterium]|nr:glycine oxidase ThiO [Planctomycetia bacterium]
MTTTPDYLIIGGGIVGCSLALELARAGASVVVLERGAVGCASSSAAAGLLAPTFGPSPPGPLQVLCQRGALLYREWLDELHADGAQDVGYRQTGLLTVCLDASEAAQVRGLLSTEAFPGRRAEWLDAGQLRAREPALCDRVLGAGFYPDDCHLDPAFLVRETGRAAAMRGVEVREHEPVMQLDREGTRLVAVHTERQTYRPQCVVVAAGAWSGALAATLGLKLPTRPVKGQMLMAECAQLPVQTPLHAGNALLIPWPDGRLAIGVTVEEAGFDDRVRLDSLRQILNRVIELVPSVGGLALSHAWAGLRPATPNDWPYMGPVPTFDNVWISAGHYRKGTLLAPICARLLAKSLLAGRLVEELAAFHPGDAQSHPTS